MPRLQYPDGFQVVAEACELEADTERQLLILRARLPGTVTVTIRRRG